MKFDWKIPTSIKICLGGLLVTIGYTFWHMHEEGVGGGAEYVIFGRLLFWLAIASFVLLLLRHFYRKASTAISGKVNARIEAAEHRYNSLSKGDQARVDRR